MQIQTGTATVENGETRVIAAVGVDWGAVTVGSLFTVPANGVLYGIASTTAPGLSVSGRWEIELAAPYGGATVGADAVPYVIAIDFTPNLHLPLIKPGDSATAELFSRAMAIIDEAISDFESPQGAQGFQGAQGYQGSQGAQGYQGHQGAQGYQGSQGGGGAQGVQGYQGVPGVDAMGDPGPQGFQGYQGAQGTPGGAITLPFTFSTTTTDSDPGNGFMRLFTTLLQSNASVARLDNVGSDGQTYSGLYSSLVPGQIRFQKVSDPTKWALFTVTGATAMSGYYNIAITPVLASTSNPFANGDAVLAVYSRTGATGAQGAQGFQGAQGNQGAQGAQGSQGTQGNQGTQGVQGAQGTGGDIVANLISAEVPITAAVTLTSTAFGKMHVCTGTTANYTVTLPAVSGNAGKVIGFRMANALTKLVTLDGNAAETIDSVATRIMWSGEVAILECDGASWHKISGVTRAFLAKMTRVAAQAIAGSTNVKLAWDTVAFDASGLFADATTNDRFNIPRPGKYRMTSKVLLLLADGVFFQSQFLLNTFAASLSIAHSGLAYYTTSALCDELSLAAGNFLELQIYHSDVISRNTDTNWIPTMTVEEIPDW